jgi:hypothetical protein
VSQAGSFSGHGLRPAFGAASQSCRSKVASTISVPRDSRQDVRGSELHGVIAAQAVVPRQCVGPLHERFRDRNTNQVRPIACEGPLGAPCLILRVAYSTMACITAVSKSRSTSRFGFDVCTSMIPTSFSFGSIHECVPHAPIQPKLPGDTL